MDFRFTSDERELIDQAGKSFRRYLPAERVVLGQPTVDGWRSVAEEGWLSAGLPESVGGGGLPLVITAGIAREAGGVLAADAFVNNAVLIPRLACLSAAGSWVEDVLAHPGFLVTSMEGGATGDSYGDELGLFPYRIVGGMLERHRPDELTYSPHGGFGVTTGSVRLDGSSEAEESVALARDVEDVFRDAAIIHAAGLVGAAAKAVEDTVEYVKTRTQFGGPIGRFQAVKHMLADVTVTLEVAWNGVLYAALRPSPESVDIACLQSSRAADQVARAMIQLFGGIAMTWEHHAHWYVKVLESSKYRFGSSSDRAMALTSSFIRGESA